MLLRLFGAKVGTSVRVYNSARFFLPRNVQLDDHCTIGPNAEVYCVAKIQIASAAIISQNAELCAATHDYNDPSFPLVPRPILIGASCWICAGAFIGPGVAVGEGAVVGARAVAFKDISPLAVVAGNPAIQIRTRRIQLISEKLDSNVDE
jgi:putative colanic acid biosynthesis acetyltransferase WcaF